RTDRSHTGSHTLTPASRLETDAPCARWEALFGCAARSSSPGRARDPLPVARAPRHFQPSECGAEGQSPLRSFPWSQEVCRSSRGFALAPRRSPVAWQVSLLPVAEIRMIAL